MSEASCGKKVDGRWSGLDLALSLLAFALVSFGAWFVYYGVDTIRTPENTISNTLDREGMVYYSGPRSVVTYANLGNNYARNGEYDLAVACYKKVLELDPNFGYGHLNLGNIYFKKGDLDSAIVCYKKATELTPSVPEARRNLATARNNLAYIYAERDTNEEELNQAEVLVNDALRSEPNNGYFLDTKGWILYKQGRYKEAGEYFEKAMRLLPSEKEILAHGLWAWVALVDQESSVKTSPSTTQNIEIR